MRNSNADRKHRETISSIMPAERVQKVLARIGIGSRREIERWIKAKRIEINGRLAILGDSLAEHDKICLDGKPLNLPKNTASYPRMLMYYKPAREICSRKDPQQRNTVFDNLPPLQQGRWISVGRLDFNTSGLLLFSNDGQLANDLMHPSANIEREYAVRVIGQVNATMLKRLQTGIRIDNAPIQRFTDIVDAGGKGANHWYYVTLMEGRNREVKHLWESQGITVSRLLRVRFGNIILPRGYRPGNIKELTKEEIDPLLKLSKIRKEHPVRKKTPR